MNPLINQDQKYIWHPYTQMKDSKSIPPILITKAKGLKLYDVNGNWYYDTISSWWCNTHGHGHPYIKRAIKKQLNSLEHVLFAGFTHKPAIELAKKLIHITPKHLTKVFYSDNGSTAVEVALKMSYQYWQNKGIKGKIKFLSFDMGYHGDTIGAMTVSGGSLFNEKFKGLFFDSLKTKAPYCYRCPFEQTKNKCKYECVKSLEDILKKNSKKISAMILEPLVMAAGGMIIYPKEYLKKVGILARKYNVHLIVDEIATGFGRTGKMFAIDHVAGLKPDFMCVSKGITSGYLPLAATLTTDKIYNAFYDDYEKKKTFYHGHTYTANPIACSAAVATLDVFKKENTLSRMNKLIPYLQERLKVFKDLDLVGDVRQLGFIVGIELVENKKTKKPFGLKKRVGQEIYKQGLAKHLVLRPLGNIVYLYLPLVTTKKQLDYILDQTFEILIHQQ